MTKTRPEKDRVASERLADWTVMGESPANVHDGSGRSERPTHPVPPGEPAGAGPAAARVVRRTPRSLLAGLRVRARFPGRPRLWVEVLLIGVAYWVYSLVRNSVPEQRATAMDHAREIWHAERSVRLGVEHWANHSVNAVDWLIIGMNYYYATLHFIVTLGVLVWLFRRHPGRYAAARMTLLATTVMALLGYYLYPLAPPRLMGEGFVDTVLVHRTWGSFASGDMASVSNQFAAMPSMHIGWSTWCAVMLVMFARRGWVKALGVLYPVATLVVIVSTGNHFWLDAAGGLACLAAGFGVAHLVHGRWPHRFPRQPVERPAVVVPAQQGRARKGRRGGSGQPSGVQP
jgi:PAP2 superfamily